MKFKVGDRVYHKICPWYGIGRIFGLRRRSRGTGPQYAHIRWSRVDYRLGDGYDKSTYGGRDYSQAPLSDLESAENGLSIIKRRHNL